MSSTIADNLNPALDAGSWHAHVTTIDVIVICILMLIYQKTKPLAIPASLPGPKRHFFIGHLNHAIRTWDDWPNETTRLCKLYKATWGGPLPNLGGLPGGYVYISDKDSIKHVLSDEFDSYIKGDIWRKVFGELLGEGIFTVDGAEWRVHRKLMSTMFSRNLLRRSAAAMREKLEQVLNIYRIKASENGSKGFDIDIQEVFFCITFDVSSSVILGLDFDTVVNQQQRFHRAFDELSSLCQKRFLDPFFEIKKFLNISWRERRIKQLAILVDDFAMSVIRDRRNEINARDKSIDDRFDLLTKYIEHAENNKEEVSDKYLRDVLMNVMLAGRDTTACALSWTWYELTRHPEIVLKIVDEVRKVCGVGDGADCSFDTMNQLKYTHCVALEVLRLHPPVTNDPRYAKRDSRLPDGTFTAKGLGVDMCFYAMGRKEDIWGSDALHFKPERFLKEKEPSTFKFPVFNAGPRMCLGKPLALMNMKLTMAILLTSGLQLDDKKGHSGDYLWSLVQSMKGGFPIHVSSSPI
mmetsp:Transcript_6055/g.9176  ORF Transcript_6055/g.9176 Transcript_6055/m.9176 type:complete len:522 (+) Transcript_6055:23-1588(+)